MKVKTPAEGGICESLQGRDKGDLYLILQVLPNGYVLVVDGDKKKLGCPKKKNLKHLYLLPASGKDYGLDFSGGRVSDSQIAYALKLCKSGREQKRQKE